MRLNTFPGRRAFFWGETTPGLQKDTFFISLLFVVTFIIFNVLFGVWTFPADLPAHKRTRVFLIQLLFVSVILISWARPL